MTDCTDAVFPAESDIVDQLQDLPDRPDSRLGFNAHASPTPSLRRSKSSTLKWTRSLFQRIGMSASAAAEPEIDQDITTVTDDELADVPLSPPLSVSSATSSSAWSSPLPDIEEEDVCIVGREDYEMAPSEPSLTVAELEETFPRALSDSPKHRFSCLPSPLSRSHGFEEASEVQHYEYVESSPNPARLSYPEHGLSRQALLHRKWLWAMREEEWDTYTSRVRESTAYDGIWVEPPSPWRRSPPSPKSPKAEEPEKPDTAPSVEPLPPLSIHPRRGDLTALRDPYFTHMDRCFAAMPIWTINKTLWMLDLQVGIERARLLSSPDQDDFSEDLSEGELAECDSLLQMSVSGISNDSETTLVDDGESCRVESACAFESACACEEGFYDVELYSPLSASSTKDSFPTSVSAETFQTSVSSGSIMDLKPKAKVQVDFKKVQWQTNCYKRWELLVDIMRRTLDGSAVDEATSFPSSPSSPTLSPDDLWTEIDFRDKHSTSLSCGLSEEFAGYSTLADSDSLAFA